MQLRWTEEAVADLSRIADYLFEERPAYAPRILQAIYDAPSSLLTFPERGRPGRKSGTRELVLPSSPYLIVYVVANEAIHVVRILHGAQKWP
jgi:addiction module RelE/StbE family toxin